MQLTKVTAAARLSPTHAVKVGNLEVIAYPGSPRWGYGYRIRLQNGRVAYGRRNADEYLAGIANDAPIAVIDNPDDSHARPA